MPQDLLKVERANRQTTAIRASSCYLFKGSKVLLQMKAKGKFGEGHWNVPGGKIKENETPEQAAIREVYEETGLRAGSLELVGRLLFVFAENEECNHEVFVFSSKNFTGETKASDEGELRWFEKGKLPMKQMWADDEHWVPLLLNGKKFTGEFYFDSYESQKITNYSLKETQSIPY